MALFLARFALICVKKIFSKFIGQPITQIKILYIRSTHKTHDVPRILALHIKTVPDLIAANLEVKWRTVKSGGGGLNL